ncbi:MAG: TonB-dependent receptor [Planctomycetes bacterium]|nr:TonB-dependent receptor [Planctomycetota bacterium]
MRTRDRFRQGPVPHHGSGVSSTWPALRYLRPLCWILLGALFASARARAQQESGVGSIRGVVFDQDFDAPLGAATVLALETGRQVQTSDQGQYLIEGLPPGRYTIVVSKAGYVRQVRADVIVSAGQLTDVDAYLTGEFTEMEEFVVQDVLDLGAGTEAALLSLRLESPALLDSIGADLMSRAGASDAASALRLVAGASVQDGKYAVIRGLPDRYVSSQLNGVRLPTADEDKRAVELDQFPSPVIQSIQVSKTFTPDQQGDASGGAVDVRLRGIPEEASVAFSVQYSENSQVAGRSDFLTYRGGGVGPWGRESSSREIQYDNLGGNWTGAAGTITDDAPIDWKWSLSGGGQRQISDDVRIGGFASFFYERDSSFYDNGRDDSYWVENAGDPMTPQYSQGAPSQGEFKTSLFDVTKGSQSVQWGGLATIGIESENHALVATFLYSSSTEDTATLATDTRGKEYYFPGYNRRDPTAPGNTPDTVLAAPYLRTETLEYTERQTGSLQLSGRHLVPMGGFEIGAFRFDEPTLRWTLSQSYAELYQPDKRQFGALWQAASLNPGFPPFVPPFTSPAVWLPFTPAANFNLGNFQRIWKDIDEDSQQASFDLTFPFQQWGNEQGYVKFGLFDDKVDRTFDQDTFSNFGDAGASYQAGWNEPWSAVFDQENHPISQSTYDVDYRGEIDIFAWYGMVDLPLSSTVDVITGARVESTKISVVNDPGPDAVWYPPGASAPVDLNPGDADVALDQSDVLPSLALNWTPAEQVTLRTSVSRTIARQTFKELTPILQQEYLGGPIFIGNPELSTSELVNYDVRVDWRPYQGGFVSASWFHKDVRDAIEYVQRPLDFTFTTPVNYPKGRLTGVELEVRQDLQRFADSLRGFSVGANGTLIDSQVTLPDDEAAMFSLPGVEAPMSTRDMTNAPEFLLNLYGTYDIESTGTQLSLFYTIQGDTLVAGAGVDDGNFVPNVYAQDYDTLNFSVRQKLGRFFRLDVAIKNLTNPEIQEVYRSEYIGDDVLKTSYTKGIEYSIALGASFTF